MNSRCAGHPKHTLAPGYSSRRTCSSMARELQPSGTASGQVQLSPPGTWAPNPALSTHLSLSHWEQWEYLQRSRICFFWKQRWWRQISSQIRPCFPLPGTCSSSHSLAPYPWLHLPCSGLPAAAKTFWSLSVLGWAARDRSFFCHSCFKSPKPKPILFGLPCGHRMDLLPTKAWAQTPTEAFLLPACVYLLFVWRKRSNNLEKSLQFAQEVL